MVLDSALYHFFIFSVQENLTKIILYILLFIALGITASDQIANIFKFGFERLRPCHDPSLEGLIREVKCGVGFILRTSNSFL
jgi:undecaprenyl-diphosphatase